MGHQTHVSKCNKCGEVIIKTIVSHLSLDKEVVTTNCKCKKLSWYGKTK